MAKTVVIFGGSGFIGSYIVRRLSKLGYRIIIPTSNLNKAIKLKISGEVGQILPLNLKSLKYENIASIIDNCDFVINLKTIWLESKKITYNKQIFELNKFIVDILKNSTNHKYIFFSGIGINLNANSKRTLAIAKSEEYIKNHLKNYSVIRPSIVVGLEDKFLNKLLPLFKFSLFVPIFGDGKTKIQPVYVDDIALAVEKLILSKKIDNNIYELGGNKIYSYIEIYKLISKIINKRRIFIFIPFFIARFLVFFIEKLPIDLINREQLKLFKMDNLVGKNFFSFKNLNINVSDVEQVINKVIKNRY
tara:strand:- start:2033 stop:2947 length:915 start_codon:yes stop_codon:yes gene_type:complete